MTRPNILFILIDDLGCRDLGCFGSTFYETPNLDRLATEGLLFTDAYASCPVCSPTRASVMTGKYPATLGLTNFIGGRGDNRLLAAPYIHYLPLEETAIAAALREGGYHTWHVGKWHLGDQPFYPEQHGFDINLGGCRWGMPKQGYFSPWGIETLADGPEGQYLTDRLTDEAVSLIRNHDGERPFFMHLSHYAVHIPIQAPEPLVEKYRAKAKRQGLDQVEAIVEGEYYAGLHLQDRRVRRRLLQSDPTYAAMMENLDWNLGRVLQALEESGQRENTMIIFTSDNGGCCTSEGSPTCCLPMAEGKGWMYEGGTRVCQFVVWPAVVAPHRTCDVPVTTTDFYPTFLEAAGLPLRPDQHRDGVSLMPVLRGGDALDREAIYWHYPHYSNQGGRPGSSVRAGDWKLIEFFEDGRLELYNLRDDVSEQHNLAAAEPERARHLHELLRVWRHTVEARIPEPNPNYVQQRRTPDIDPRSALV